MASSYHRFAMVALAIAGRGECRATDLELREAGPSYTSDTLRRFQSQGFDPADLFFIIGADAFARDRDMEELSRAARVVTFRGDFAIRCFRRRASGSPPVACLADAS